MTEDTAEPRPAAAVAARRPDPIGGFRLVRDLWGEHLTEDTVGARPAAAGAAHPPGPISVSGLSAIRKRAHG